MKFTLEKGWTREQKIRNTIIRAKIDEKRMKRMKQCEERMKKRGYIMLYSLIKDPDLWFMYNPAECMQQLETLFPKYSFVAIRLFLPGTGDIETTWIWVKKKRSKIPLTKEELTTIHDAINKTKR